MLLTLISWEAFAVKGSGHNRIMDLCNWNLMSKSRGFCHGDADTVELWF